MQHFIDVNILRIFVPESERHSGQWLYEVILDEARIRGLAQAVAFRGIAGFGADHLLRKKEDSHLAENPLMVVEIMDTPSKIAAFLPMARVLAKSGSMALLESRATFLLPLTARDIMSQNVATVDQKTPLEDIVRVLLRRNIKVVPVMDGARLAGIITGGDLLTRGSMPLRLDMHGRLPMECRTGFTSSLTAQSIMTTPVRTLHLQSPLDEALKVMVGQGIKRLPVTDDDGILMGLVSRTDVLTAILRAWTAAGHLHVFSAGLQATTHDILQTSVSICGPDELLVDILPRISATSFRQVVVVDEIKKVLGIVHDWDVLEHCAKQPDLINRVLTSLTKNAPPPNELAGYAKDIMDKDYPFASLKTRLPEIIQILVERKKPHMIITDDNHCLQGVVSRNMVLQKLAET